ncbi:hypothetical protein D3C74_478080 [compost metagenome]
MRGEHNRFDPAALILQRKIHMAAAMMGEIGDFTADPYIREQNIRIQLHADIFVKILDG